jgi:transcriptional regulator with XRE-family HTH domain
MGKRTEKSERTVTKSKQDLEFLVQIGLRIQQIRRSKGITQMELSYRCEMERSNMRRIEAGGTNPTILTLRKIASALGVEIDEILKEVQAIHPQSRD